MSVSTREQDARCCLRLDARDVCSARSRYDEPYSDACRRAAASWCNDLGWFAYGRTARAGSGADANDVIGAACWQWATTVPRDARDKRPAGADVLAEYCTADRIAADGLGRNAPLNGCYTWMQDPKSHGTNDAHMIDFCRRFPRDKLCACLYDPESDNIVREGLRVGFQCFKPECQGVSGVDGRQVTPAYRTKAQIDANCPAVVCNLAFLADNGAELNLTADKLCAVCPTLPSGPPGSVSSTQLAETVITSPEDLELFSCDAYAGPSLVGGGGQNRPTSFFDTIPLTPLQFALAIAGAVALLAIIVTVTVLLVRHARSSAAAASSTAAGAPPPPPVSDR